MIQIVCARTDALWQEMQKALGACHAQGERCIVLVPEQRTLRTEQDILAGLALKGYFTIDVMSPSRFCERVFENAGADTRTCLDERGSGVAAARALTKAQGKLCYYTAAAEKSGMAQRTAKWIKDMKNAGVTPQTLTEESERDIGETLREKLTDLAQVYEQYEAQLGDTLADHEDIQQVMLERLQGSGTADDANVFVYGFDLLTEQYGRMLEKIGETAKNVFVYMVCARAQDEDGEAFEPVRASISRFQKLLYEDGQAYETKYLKDEDAKDRPPELKFLQKNFLCAQPTAAQMPVHAVEIYSAPTPYAEVQHCAEKIILEYERGVPFAQMSVLCAGLDEYAAQLAAVFRASRIPVHIAKKQPALQHGAVRCFLSALHASDGFRTRDVMDMLKSGYTDVSREDGWALETYAEACGIDGVYWTKPFTRNGRKYLLSPETEEARKTLIAPVLRFRKAIVAAQDADASLAALYQLLMDLHIYDKINAESAKQLDMGLPAQAAQTEQAWSLLMGLMDQLHAILQGERLPGAHIAQWLEAGLQDCELASLPPDEDSVMCGEIGNLFPEGRVLFMTGLTNGAPDVSAAGLLTDDEQRKMQTDMKVHISLDSDEREMMRRLDLWKAICSPKEKLYLSHAQASQDGKAKRPDKMLDKIRKILPTLCETGGLIAPQEPQMPLAPLSALNVLARRARDGEMTGEWLQSYRLLAQSPEWKPYTDKIAGAVRGEEAEEMLSPDTARGALRRQMLSVSRLEEFAMCPFRHFVRYVLEPVREEKWEVNRADMGNFYHAALEGFTRELPNIPAWPNIDREECDKAMEKALSPLTRDMENTPMGDSARARAMTEKYKSVLRRVAWTFTKTSKESLFRPDRSEVRFGYDDDGIPPLRLTLSSGRQVLVRGKIDRIDRYQGDAGLYLRVVDYKSGDKDMDAARIWWGMQLQLLLYLEAALSSEQGALPAGVFYQKLDDPLVQADVGEIETELAKKLRLHGVALDDVSVLEAMDSSDGQVSTGMLGKSREPLKSAHVLSLEKMRSLITYAHSIAATLADRMEGGEIKALPHYVGKENNTCSNCDYRGVCRRDALLSDPSKERIVQMSFQDLILKI